MHMTMESIKAPNPTDRKEKARHGDIFLPVVHYHSLIPDSYTELALHWHDEMEITLIREGCSNYRIGQTTLRAEAGDLLIVPPCTLHSALELPGEIMVSDSLVFHPDFLGAAEPDLASSRYLRPLMNGSLTVNCRIRQGDSGCGQIQECFMETLRSLTEKQPFYELHIKERLLHTLYLLFFHGIITTESEPASETENRRQLQNVLRYISEHYREHMTIPELAAVSGFSESHFMSFFRQNAGMSCIRYINHYRIHKAAAALKETDLPVMDIAMDHGFDNISWFNHEFRKELGMTPREFRRARREAE